VSQNQKLEEMLEESSLKRRKAEEELSEAIGKD